MRAEQKGMAITMARGELSLVFWRVQDLWDPLKAAEGMGLPLTSPQSVADKILGLLLPHLVDVEGRA